MTAARDRDRDREAGRGMRAQHPVRVNSAQTRQSGLGLNQSAGESLEIPVKVLPVHSEADTRLLAT